MLPLLREAFVTPGWVSDDAFCLAMARPKRSLVRFSLQIISGPKSVRSRMGVPVPQWGSSGFFFPAC